MIKNLSLEEKIGQMCVPILQSGEITEDVRKYIVDYKIGMLRFCPNAWFDSLSEIIGEPNKYRTASEMAEFTNEIQNLAEIPLIIAVDQEGSTRNDVNRAGALAYSGHMSFGAADDVDLTYKIAYAAGKEFRAMGINLVQAPIVDVLRYEGRQTMKAATFGQDQNKVKEHAVAMMKGYQDAGIGAMAKHFPGYGSIATDAHKGIAEITKIKDLFIQEDVFPLKAVIESGVDGIMTGHAITHCIDKDLPATVSKKMITGFLRETLNYDGIVETDAMRMSAIQSLFGTEEASIMAVNAGCDLVLLRGDFQHFIEGYEAILEAVRSGKIKMSRIDEAVGRILKLKEKLKLFDNKLSDPEIAKNTVGCSDHRKITAELAEKSITTLKGADLPLSTSDKIAVVSVTPQKIGATLDKEQNIEMLINAIKAKAQNVKGLMVKLSPDEADIKAALSFVMDSDVIILGVCNTVIYKVQKALVDALYNTGKKLVVVAMDSPFDIEEYPYVKNYVCTYGVANDWMIAAANVIFGEKAGNAKPPVTITKTLTVLGDSISVCYSQFLDEAIKNKPFVFIPKTYGKEAFEDLNIPVGLNCGDSRMMLDYIKNICPMTSDVYVMNCGLHDIKTNPITNERQVSEEDYYKNLDKIFEFFNSKNKKLYFVNTTPAIADIHNAKMKQFLRYEADVSKCNQTAEELCKKHNIKLIDLYSFTSLFGNDAFCDHVHYYNDIAKMQADFIVWNMA